MDTVLYDSLFTEIDADFPGEDMAQIWAHFTRCPSDWFSPSEIELGIMMDQSRTAGVILRKAEVCLFSFLKECPPEAIQMQEYSYPELVDWIYRTEGNLNLLSTQVEKTSFRRLIAFLHCPSYTKGEKEFIIIERRPINEEWESYPVVIINRQTHHAGFISPIYI